MPPKAKITRQMILEAAFELVCKKGHENLNARSIAKELNCSTQPVLYHFQSIDEIRQEVYKKADEYHTAYIAPSLEDSNPLLAIGLNYIRFGYEQKNLFRFLFQTNQFGGMRINDLLDHPDLSQILHLIEVRFGCSPDEAREVFLAFFAIVHGLASLLANNALEYNEKQNARILKEAFSGLLSSRRKDSL